MRTYLQSALLAIVLSGVLVVAGKAAVSDKAKGAQMAAIMELADKRFPVENGSRASTRRAADKVAIELYMKVQAYIGNDVKGQDRAKVILALSERAGPYFITHIDPAYNDMPSEDLLTFDVPARSAARANIDRWLEAVKADATATQDQRRRAAFQLFHRKIPGAKTKSELDALQRQLESSATAGELSTGSLAGLERAMIFHYSAYDLTAYQAFLARLATLGDQTIANLGKQELAAVEKRKKQATQIKFVAVDGRQVDVSKMRGKTVLVDFWGTWCVSCIEELPGVLSVYRKYHDKGFEVVGIAYENAELKPNDKPEQTAEKLGGAKRKLLAYIERTGTPWPQYFDGKYFDAPFSERFGITALPVTLLIDANGQLVSVGARGAQLMEMVGKLVTQSSQQ